MIIRFAIVSPSVLPQVHAEVGFLQSAVESGGMDDVDRATANLLGLTAGCSFVDLSEDKWRTFLVGIQSKSPEFQAGYLLSGGHCTTVLPMVTANDCVLALPIDGGEGEEGIIV